MKHIYTCTVYNIENEKIEYEKFYGEDVRKIRKVFGIFQNNFENREQNMKNNNPQISGRVDPLYNYLYSTVGVAFECVLLA